MQLEEIERTFSHENIIDAIEHVYYDLRNVKPQKHNEIVRRLLHFFLRKTSTGYILKEYAMDFCKLIEAEIASKFNPTQTEIKFQILLNSLKSGLSSEESFEGWSLLNFHFLLP